MDDTFLGVFERAGTHNTPIPTEQVHGWIHEGYKGTLAPLPPEPGQDLKTEADEVLFDDHRAIGLDQGDVSLELQAMPTRLGKLERFYEGGGASLHDILIDIPQLRPAGFNLPDGIDPERTPHGSLRVVWKSSDSLSVTRSGITTAIQGQEHLTWAYQNFAARGELWINPVALVEFTLEFSRFHIAHVLSRIQPEADAVWRVGMRNLQKSQIKLPERADHFSQRHPALADAFLTSWAPAPLEAGRFAHQILAEVYAEFGFDHAVIPFSVNGQIDAQAIQTMKR
ncbi:MAG: hypothetical protein HY873_08780 [Chloroflexi bacterium]|nr:hypothetical protein [Chloroflexota bacterium]